LAKEFGSRSVLIITDPILRKIGLVDRVLTPLREASIETTVFDGVGQEPSISVARKWQVQLE